MESILQSIKTMLGIADCDHQFDPELIMFINSSISKLIQMGVGPNEGFSITGSDETWEELFEGAMNINCAKEYVYLDVRMVFDPPSNAFVAEAFKEHKDEIAWRLCTYYDANHPDAHKEGGNSND